MNLSTKTKELPTRIYLIAEALQNYIKQYDSKASESERKELENAFWMEAQACIPLKVQGSIGRDLVSNDIHYTITKWLSVSKYAKITGMAKRTVCGLVECKELNHMVMKSGSIKVEMRIGVSRKEYQKIFGGDGK